MERRTFLINGVKATPLIGLALTQTGDTGRQRGTTATKVQAVMGSPNKEPGVLLNRKDPPPERVKAAREHLKTALDNVKKDPSVAKDLSSVLPDQNQQEAFFLAMAMKESKVHPNPPPDPHTPAGAKPDSVSYFQVRKTAVEEVNRLFFQSLNKTFDHASLSKAPIAGMECGILYFTIAIRQARGLFPAMKDPQERLKLALTLYNGGIGNVKALLTKAKTNPSGYAAWSALLDNLALEGAPPDRIPALRRAGTAVMRDKEYAVEYPQSPGIRAYLENRGHYDAQATAKKTIPGLKGKDGKDFQGSIPHWKPAVMLRYAELIPAMAQAIAKELPELGRANNR